MKKQGTMHNGQLTMDNGQLPKGDTLSLPKGWKMKKLGEVCKVERGSSPRPIKQYLTESNDGVNWIKIGDTKNVEKYIVKTKQKITKQGAKKSRYVKKGDFILSNSMSFGKPYIMGTDGYIHDGWFVLRLNNDIDTDYFYYLLSSDYVKNQFLKLASGAVVKNISSDLTKKALLPIPPLPEQKRIVALLDRAFKAIDKAKAIAEQNLKNAKELFESYLNRIFEEKGDDWEEKKLGEVCKTSAGGTPLKTYKDYYENGNIPWLRSGEVCRKYIDKTELFITEKGLKNSSAKIFPKNTVLVAMYGATAGQVGILKIESSTNQAVCGILPNNKIIPEFIYYKFLEGKEKLVKQAVGGAQPNISQIKIKNTLIPIPSLETQKQIVQQLNALQAETKKLEAIYQQKIVDLEELKKSILQKAFNGEL